MTAQNQEENIYKQHNTNDEVKEGEMAKQKSKSSKKGIKLNFLSIFGIICFALGIILIALFLSNKQIFLAGLELNLNVAGIALIIVALFSLIINKLQKSLN